MMVLFFIDVVGRFLFGVVILVLALNAANHAWLRVSARLSRRLRLGRKYTGTKADEVRPLVVVTGGAMGIGFELVCRYANLGYDVVVWDIHTPAPVAVDRLQPAVRRRVQFSQVNVADAGSVSAAVAERFTAPNRAPDLVILNAGVVNGKRLVNGDLTPDDVHRLFSINVFQLFIVVRELLPRMQQDRQRAGLTASHRGVVVLGSVAGFACPARGSDYCSSKAAVNLFAEGLAAELREEPYLNDIVVTLVCPYRVLTGMFAGAGDILTTAPLEAGWVADCIVDGVLLKKQLVVLPRYLMSYLAFKTYVPWTWIPLVSRILGSDKAMNTFQGSPGPSKRV